METRIIKLQPDNPDIATLKAVAGRLVRGETCILPTDTIYGFHCRADNEEAVRAVHALKGRTSPRPLVVLVPGVDYLKAMHVTVPVKAKKLMDRFWPGPLTVVLSSPPHISPWLKGDLDSLAVRYPGFPILNQILEFAGMPIVSTSVNRSGESPLLEIREIIERFSGKVHCLIDAGTLALKTPSTLVSFASGPPRILRKGAIPTGLIKDLID